MWVQRELREGPDRVKRQSIKSLKGVQREFREGPQRVKRESRESPERV